MKLILLVGPPGSGKSTFAKDRIENDGDIGAMIHYVNQDTQGRDGHRKEFTAALANRENIIVDRMGFSKEQRERYLKPAKDAGYETEIVVFHVPRQTCFDRIMARENHPTINGNKAWKGLAGQSYSQNTKEITEKYQLELKAQEANSALDTFFTKYERVEDTEADKVTRLGWDGSKENCIIVDLDGTLCNIEHRLHHVKHEIKKHNRWDKFFKEIPGDSINEAVERVIKKFLYDTAVVFCSGRPDSTLKDTVDWLKKHSIYLDANENYGQLRMRHRSDFRPDYIIKEQILDFEILTKYNVLFSIDDRSSVVKMWRKRGITCFQVADGDF